MTAGTAPRESVLAGSLFGLAAQVASAVFTAVVTLFLLRALGPEGYGELTLVLSVGGLALVVADAAIAQSTGRWAADAVDDPTRLATVVSSGLRIKLWLSCGSAVLLALLAGPIARAYGSSDMVWALRVVAIAVAAESVMMLWLVLFQAVRRISLNVRLYLVESAAEAGAVVSLVLLGGGVTGAALGRAFGYAVGAATGLVLVRRVISRGLQVRGRNDEAGREILGYARPLFITLGLFSTSAQVDVQLIGGLLNRAAVGLYAAPLRLLVLLNYPAQAVANAVAPRMAGADPDPAAFRTALRWLVLYQTALLAPVIVWATPICALLLGDEFADSAPLLVALAPYMWLTGVSMLAATTVNYLGHARRRVPIVLASLLVNAATCAVLLPTVGLIGAPIAMTTSYLLYVPLHVRICRESFPLPLRALAMTLVRSLFAAGAFAVVLYALGTDDLSYAHWAAGVLLGPLAYLVALVLLGELTPSDLRRGGRLVLRLRRRRVRPSW